MLEGTFHHKFLNNNTFFMLNVYTKLNWNDIVFLYVLKRVCFYYSVIVLILHFRGAIKKIKYQTFKQGRGKTKAGERKIRLSGRHQHPRAGCCSSPKEQSHTLPWRDHGRSESLLYQPRQAQY